MKMRTIAEQKTIEERAKIDHYLDNYNLFVEVCREREDLSSIELTILHHGYVSGGQHNA